jgi:DNA-binding transcriptional MerR regulator
MSIMNAAFAVDEVVGAADAETQQNDLMRIGDVSEMFAVSLRTLRFYEDKGLITPQRNGVTRLYSRKDLGRIKLILLGRKVGFSLREVKQLIDLYEPGGANVSQMKATFEKGKRQLEKMKQQRLAIDEAIEELNNGMNQISERLKAPKMVA